MLLNAVRVELASLSGGAITLGATVDGFRAMANADATNGVTYEWVIEADIGVDGVATQREGGSGVYDTGAGTLARNTVWSTNSFNTPITVTGDAHVIITPLAETLNDIYDHETRIDDLEDSVDELEDVVYGIADITHYGAVGDDSTNNTVAVQAALNSGFSTIYVPDGIFRCGHVTIPDDVRLIFGSGTFRATGAFTAFFPWFYCPVPNSSGGRITGLTFILEATTYDTIPVVAFVNPSDWTVDNCSITGGRFSVQFFGGSTRCRAANNKCLDYAESAISAGSGDNDRLSILNNDCVHSERVAAMSIQIGSAGDGGSNNDCSIIGNTVLDGISFGIHVHYMTRGIISHNTVRRTRFEAISPHGTGVLVSHNQCMWDTGGVDVGMSTAGDDTGDKAVGIIFDSNVITGSFKGGILIETLSEDCVVQNNRIIDCNRSGGTSASGAVNMVGTTCLRTTVLGNYATNSGGGQMAFAVEESDSLIPDYSYIANNYIRDQTDTGGAAEVFGANSVATNNVKLPT